jgi:hypothetical protein
VDYFVKKLAHLAKLPRFPDVALFHTHSFFGLNDGFGRFGGVGDEEVSSMEKRAFLTLDNPHRNKSDVKFSRVSCFYLTQMCQNEPPDSFFRIRANVCQHQERMPKETKKRDCYLAEYAGSLA